MQHGYNNTPKIVVETFFFFHLTRSYSSEITLLSLAQAGTRALGLLNSAGGISKNPQILIRKPVQPASV